MSEQPKKNRRQRVVYVPIERVGKDKFVRGRLNGTGPNLRYIRVGGPTCDIKGKGEHMAFDLLDISGVVATIAFGNGEFAEVLDWHDPESELRVAG